MVQMTRISNEVVRAAMAGDKIAFEAAMTSLLGDKAGVAIKEIRSDIVQNKKMDQFESIREEASANVVGNVATPDPKPGAIVTRDGVKKKKEEKTK